MGANRVQEGCLIPFTYGALPEVVPNNSCLRLIGYAWLQSSLGNAVF